MKYGSTTEATDWMPDDWKDKALKALLWFVPRANKDIDQQLSLVKEWLVEIDNEGVANREIGLDGNGNLLFASPNDRNTGYWTDSPKIFREEELQVIEKEYFEQLWSQVSSNE